jgi:hypothetical protein
MNLETLCMICNWARDLWWSITVGAAGAAVAAGAAGAPYEDPPWEGGPYRPTEPDEVGDSSYPEGWEPTDEALERWDRTWERKQPEYWRSKDPNLTWYEDFHDWLQIWMKDATGELGRDPSAPTGSKA